MKKVLSILLFLFVALSVFGQTYNGGRIVARNGLFVKDYWITAFQRDTTFATFGDQTKVPTAKAVADYVAGRIAVLSGGSGSGIDSLRLTADTVQAKLSGLWINQYVNDYVKKQNASDALWKINHLNSASVFDGTALSKYSGAYYDGGSEKVYNGVGERTSLSAKIAVMYVGNIANTIYSGIQARLGDLVIMNKASGGATSVISLTGGSTIFNATGSGYNTQFYLNNSGGAGFSFTGGHQYTVPATTPTEDQSILANSGGTTRWGEVVLPGRLADTAAALRAAIGGGGGTDDLNDVSGRDSITVHNIEVRGNNKYIGTASDGIAFGSSFLTHNETVGGGVAVSDPAGNTATITAHKIDVDEFDYDVASSSFSVGFIGNIILQKTGNNYYFGDKDGINNQTHQHINDAIKLITFHADSLKLGTKRVLTVDKIFAGPHISVTDTAGGLKISAVPSQFKIAYPLQITVGDTVKIDTVSVSGVGTKTDIYNSRPYKVLVGNLTQTGTSAPVFTIFENTTGISYTTNYIGPGEYTITSTSGTPFTANKTWFVMGNLQQAVMQNNDQVKGIVESTTTFRIYVIDLSMGSSNDMLTNTSIEIRIYP